MYSREQRGKAVDLFIKYDLSLAPIMREFGYPCHRTLWKWYEQYLEEQKIGVVCDLQGDRG
jgi:putative transposase